jgi:hypothetical protein
MAPIYPSIIGSGKEVWIQFSIERCIGLTVNHAKAGFNGQLISMLLLVDKVNKSAGLSYCLVRVTKFGLLPNALYISIGLQCLPSVGNLCHTGPPL